MLRLLALFRPAWGWVLLGAALSLATLLANVALMATAGWFITAMAVAGATGTTINYFTPAAIIRACAIIRTTGRYGERLVTHDATLRILSRLRTWFYDHLEPLAPARLEGYRSGDLLSRIRADIDTLDNAVLRILLPLLVAALAGTLFVSLIGARYGTGAAVLEGVLLVTAGLLLPLHLRRFSAAAGRAEVVTASDLRAAAVDSIQGLEESILYGATEPQRQHLLELDRRLVAAQRVRRYSAALSQAGVATAAGLAMWGLLLLLIPAVRSGAVPPTELAMVAFFALATFEAVQPLPQTWLAWDATRSAARRIFELVDGEPEVPDPADPAPPPQHFDLAFEGMGFRYRPGGPRILQEIDLEIAEGGRVAILGPTGAGKSTLISLLLGFHRCSEGQIRLGGRPLQECDGETLRRQMATVSQRTWLFTASIRENLLLARPGADQAALEEACRRARIHDFITALPQGYDTPVGEHGARLSGGEARRIGIARALLKDAPIWLLDEPTEGLDAATERGLMETLHELMPGRTVVLITHRPLGLRVMDEIVLLDRGRILDRGDPESLRRRSRPYRRLLEAAALFHENPGERGRPAGS